MMMHSDSVVCIFISSFLLLLFLLHLFSLLAWGAVGGRWFTSWGKYTQCDDGYAIGEHSPELPDGIDAPGPIDNSDLVSDANDGEVDNLELIRTLEEGRDYVLVPEAVWNKLLEW